MKERTKLIWSLALMVIVFIFIFKGYYSIKYNTQILPVGGKNEETAVILTHEDVISAKVFIEKTDRWPADIYAYWDDEVENKQKLKKGLFIAKSEIAIPNTNGIHKLTIETGLLKVKYVYYYQIED